MAKFDAIASMRANEPDDEQRIQAIMDDCIAPGRDRIRPIVEWLLPGLADQGLLVIDEGEIDNLVSVAVTVYVCRVPKVLGVLPAVKDLPQRLARGTWPE